MILVYESDKNHQIKNLDLRRSSILSPILQGDHTIDPSQLTVSRFSLILTFIGLIKKVLVLQVFHRLLPHLKRVLAIETFSRALLENRPLISVQL